MRGDGAVVTSKVAAERAAALEIEFADGRVTVGAGARGRVRKAGETEGGQGSLF